MRIEISAVVATSLNYIIGKDGKLPWYLPKDLKRFKNLTYGHHIIMGRNTFESIGTALPGRRNIVISTTLRYKDYPNEDIEIFEDLKTALKFILERRDQIFIIGGQQIFRTALPFIDKIYLTQVQEYIEGDAMFPIIGNFENPYRWKLIEYSKHYQDNKHYYNFDFKTLMRIENHKNLDLWPEAIDTL